MNDLDTLLTHELSGNGEVMLHRPPGGREWYNAGLPDASPETSLLIRRIDRELSNHQE